jgi:hypothetical protein
MVGIRRFRLGWFPALSTIGAAPGGVSEISSGTRSLGPGTGWAIRSDQTSTKFEV